MGFSPLENLRNLCPIAHFLKREMFYRRARNNHSVELLIAHSGEVFVKTHHVFNGRILRRVAFQFHKAHFQLQGRVRKQAYKIRFGCYFQRHEVEHNNPKRPNVLRGGSRTVHHEDILTHKYVYCG